ncbi:hypothetical protein E2C01_094911 [Portunus trituberculatus]|uniref:Uncharacterized protein n=1 Tax=Portunus trituberculatus TaxID=210409 RepID=A0A5B7JY58_PORTR|nr:hypothetical protein [Portunus trituberculatus]
MLYNHSHTYHQGPRGEFLLGVVSGQSGVVFYQYNGWRFVQMSFQIKQAGIRKAWIGYLGRVNQAVLTLTHRSSSRPLVYYLRFQHFRPRMVSVWLSVEGWLCVCVSV